jgi:predicted PurR-regulated permease PerM
VSSTEHRVIDISLRSVLTILAIIFTIWLLFQIFDILILIFLAVVLAAALSPLVNYLERWMPRWLGVLAILFSFIGALATSLYLLIPPLVTETQSLIDGFQSGRLKLEGTFFGFELNSQRLAEELRQNLDKITSHAGSIWGAASGLLSGVVGVFTVLVLALYILLDEGHIRQTVTNLTPPGYRKQTLRIVSQIADKMGLWLRGQLILGVLIGVVSYIGLWLFDVKYALPLAILAGLTELLPMVGPIIAAAAAVTVAATDDWTKALLIGGWYLVVQQLEANVLIPQVFKRTLGLSPLVIVVALLIGAKLYGLLGIVLSVPAAAAISVIINEWPSLTQSKTKERD